MKALTIRGINKMYGHHQALSDVSFDIEKGSITALLGPNGAGKSSLMRIVCGISEANSGEVFLGGEELRKMSTPVSYIGALLNPDWLDKRLTCEQIMKIQAHLLKLSDIDLNIGNLLSKVGLEDSRKKKVKYLSLGMRQRLALAMAMLGDPKILILDEPVNGLDPQGVRWLRFLLHDFRDKGGTILISSHLIAEVQLIATDVIVINQGCIEFSGKIDHIQNQGAATQFECLRTEDLDKLVTYLHKVEPAARFSRESNSGVAYGVSPEIVFSVAAQNGVILKKMLERKPSLEEMYFRIVGDREKMHRSEYVYKVPNSLWKREILTSSLGYGTLVVLLFICSQLLDNLYLSLSVAFFLVVLTIVTVVELWIMTPRKIAHTRIEITDRDLVIYKGKMWKRIVYIPRRRINSVSLSQSWISRAYNQAIVTINAPTLQIDLPILADRDARSLTKVLCDAREKFSFD